MCFSPFTVCLCVTSHVVQMVHLRRFALATMMMAMVGVVAGSGLVCMHSSDSKEMANSKCALAFEDKKVCALCTQKGGPLLLISVAGLRRDILGSESHMPGILNTDLQGAIQCWCCISSEKTTACLQAARKEHNTKCIDSWKLAGAIKSSLAGDMGEAVGTKYDSGGEFGIGQGDSDQL